MKLSFETDIVSFVYSSINFEFVITQMYKITARIQHFYIRKLLHWIKSSTDKLIKNMFSSCATVFYKRLVNLYWLVNTNFGHKPDGCT